MTTPAAPDPRLLSAERLDAYRLDTHSPLMVRAAEGYARIGRQLLDHIAALADQRTAEQGAHEAEVDQRDEEIAHLEGRINRDRARINDLKNELGDARNERDRARATAVALEQELAALTNHFGTEAVEAVPAPARPAAPVTLDEYACPLGQCEHPRMFHDGDPRYEEPYMCCNPDCPCGKPTTTGDAQ